MVRECGDGRAQHEDHETHGDHRLAPDAIRQSPERDLQTGLGQTIDTERQSHHEGCRARQLIGVQGQHRYQHEQAEHAQEEYAREGKGGMSFLWSEGGTC